MRILSKPDASAIFEKAQNATNVSLPEESIKNVIESLKDRGIMILGLTSRSYHAMRSSTDKQLETLGISFQSNGITLEQKDKDVYFRNGILYSNGRSNKNDAVQLFSKATEYIPRKIIFIAASQTALEEFSESIEDIKTEYLGINYDHLNWKIKNFDLSVADVQREHHDQRNVILSDRDAMRLLNQRCSG